MPHTVGFHGQQRCLAARTNVRAGIKAGLVKPRSRYRSSKPVISTWRLMAAKHRYEQARRHAFVQNLRRGHHDIATDVPACHRLRTAFDDLATTI
jgi:hypothetical protein